jgi:hypothetical protein
MRRPIHVLTDRAAPAVAGRGWRLRSEETHKEEEQKAVRAAAGAAASYAAFHFSSVNAVSVEQLVLIVM